jgi:hexosaminidase
VNPLPAGRAALAIILAELASAVDSPYLHIGGDEADLTDWVASADIQQHLARHGMATVDELRADLTRFLVDQVTALGRRPVVWEEAFLAGGLSPQTIVMAWRAETNGLAAMAAGHDVVMTPMDRTYLDYADTAEDGLALGSGQSVARVAEYTPARGDGPGALLGTQAALWTEFVPDARTRAARMFPRLSIHAANAWTGTATAWPAARPALQAHLERLAAAGVEYRPLDGPHPWQQGGHGRRASVSPLTVDMVAAMLTAFVGDAGTPSAEDLETLLAGIEPAEPVPTP